MLRIPLLFLLSLQAAYGAFEQGGSVVPGLGGAATALSGSALAAFANPACLATAGVRTLAISHTPRPFGIGQLARTRAVLVEPFPAASLALSAERFGFELYREVSFGFSAALHLVRGWDGGLTIRSHHLSIAGYGTATALGIDAGLLVELTDDACAGFSARNINAPAIGAARERLPQVLSLGASYSPFAAVRMTVDVVKDVRYPLELHAGFEYAPADPLLLRAGSGTEPSSFHAGVALRVSPVEALYGYSSHAELGGTHHFALHFALDMF